MTYDPTIPFGAQNLSVSQVAIQTNFNQLNVQFGNDHTGFNTGSGNGNGFHKKSTYISQGGDPVTGSNQFAVYNKSDKLYGRGQNNGTVFEILGTFVSAQNGYIKLYGNILVQWGRGTITVGATGQATVTYPIAFSATPYTVLATLYGSPVSDASRGFGVLVASINTTQFTVQNFNSGVPNNTTFGWLAIGPTT